MTPYFSRRVDLVLGKDNEPQWVELKSKKGPLKKSDFAPWNGSRNGLHKEFALDQAAHFGTGKEGDPVVKLQWVFQQFELKVPPKDEGPTKKDARTRMKEMCGHPIKVSAKKFKETFGKTPKQISKECEAWVKSNVEISDMALLLDNFTEHKIGTDLSETFTK
jgi:hypothetical protein